MSIMKNIPSAEVLKLKDEVEFQKGQVVSKTLAQSDAVSLTLFAFEKGEEISTHKSGGDAMVVCLEGRGKVQIDDNEYELHEGDTVVMPADHPHSVHALDRFKMFLIVVF